MKFVRIICIIIFQFNYSFAADAGKIGIWGVELSGDPENNDMQIVVLKESMAEKSGLISGDTILSINGHKTTTLKSFEAVLQLIGSGNLDNPLHVVVIRDSKPYEIRSEYTIIEYTGRPINRLTGE
jgi:C-terminal processing protease CtpA/Prc